MKVAQARTMLPSDESFLSSMCCSDEPQLGKSRGKKRGKLTRARKTRGMVADKQKGPKSFTVMLEEVKVACAAC